MAKFFTSNENTDAHLSASDSIETFFKRQLPSNPTYCAIMGLLGVTGALLYPLVLIVLYTFFSLLSGLPSWLILQMWEDSLFLRLPSVIEVIFIYVLVYGLGFYLSFSFLLPFSATVSSYYRSLVRLAFSRAKVLLFNHENGFILYLRSFRSDYWRSTSFTYGPFWIPLNPFQGIIKFISSIRWRFEEVISSVFFKFSTLVTCVEPEAKWRADGSIRIPLGGNEWRKEILQLMKEADFILIGVDSTDGLNWEQEVVLEQGFLEKTVFLCHNPDGTASYEKLIGIGSRISEKAKNKVVHDSWFPCKEYAVSFFDGEIQLYSGKDGIGMISQITLCFLRVMGELERVRSRKGRDLASRIEFYLLDLGLTFLISAFVCWGIIASASEVAMIEYEFHLYALFFASAVCVIVFSFKAMTLALNWYKFRYGVPVS